MRRRRLMVAPEREVVQVRLPSGDLRTAADAEAARRLLAEYLAAEDRNDRVWMTAGAALWLGAISALVAGGAIWGWW